MRPEGLFLNGVYEAVFEEILQIQSALPELIMFLKPYKEEAIVRLRDNPPTVEDPVRVVMSLTNDLAKVHSSAEIVGWEDKRGLPPQRRQVGGGLFNESRTDNGESANLLHVRRLRRLSKPFRVTRLVKSTDNEPISDKRTTAGGWVYINSDLGELVD